MERPDIRIVRGGPERIPDLEALFGVLHEHQTAVAPTLGGMKPRSAAEAWERRKARYEEWLGRPGAFALIADDEREQVGYAVVSIAGGYQGWISGDRVGEVHDIAVIPSVRGRGIGTLLMDQVEHELSESNVHEYRLNVIAANTSAIRFYEQRGMTLVSYVMFGRS